MDWKELLKLSPEEKAKVKYNDPRLDSFAATVEERYGLPPGIIEAVKNAGERTNTGLVSKAGAKGVMQFIDSTRQLYKHNPDDPLASIDAAGQYFKDLLKTTRGNVKAALAQYNGGTKARKAVEQGLEPPAEETRNYIQRVMDYGKQKFGGRQNEGEGSAPKPGEQTLDETAKKFTLADLAREGFLTEEGRKSFREKLKKEFKAAKSNFSNSDFYGESAYPDKMEMLYTAENNLKGLNERQIAAIGLDTPFSKNKVSTDSSGYVYHNNPDRAFLAAGADVQTAVHEKEHLTTQRKLKQVSSLGKIGRLDEPVPALLQDLVLKKGKDFVDKDPVLSKVFRASNSFSSPNEMLSNIAQYETSLPVGTSIYDSPFKTKLVEMYGEDKAKAVLDQAVAYTLTDKGRISESDKKFMKKVDSNESYAKQLYQYLKQKFED